MLFFKTLAPLRYPQGEPLSVQMFAISSLSLRERWIAKQAGEGAKLKLLFNKITVILLIKGLLFDKK